MKRVIKNQNGMIEIEAIFVIVVWMNIIFFLMNLGVIVYQQMNVFVAANEAAANAAESYSILKSDPFIHQVTVEDIKNRSPYRYWDSLTYENWIEDKAEWYACFRVKGNEFSEDETGGFDNITTNFKKEKGMRILEVDVSREYSVLILNPMVVFGIDPKYTVSAKGSAVCYDVIHDMNMIAWEKEVEDYVGGMTLLGKTVSNFIKFVGKLVDCFTGKE